DKGDGIIVLPDVFHQCGFQRRIGKLVHAQSPKKRIGADLLDQIFSSAEQAGLGAAQHFVTAIGNQIDSGAQTLQHATLVDAQAAQRQKCSATQIFHYRDAVLVSQCGQLFQGRLLGKPDDREIGAVDPQK